MVSRANVRNYKSNQRPFVHDRWRYNEEEPTHIALEHRLALEYVGGNVEVGRLPGWVKCRQEMAAELGDQSAVFGAFFSNVINTAEMDSKNRPRVT